jgi:hypothetical protein
MREDQEADGLSNFDLGQIGMSGGAFGSARILKFDTDHFVTREGEVIGPERELIVLGLKKIVQKFVAKRLMETIVVPDGQKAPDIKAMNGSAPREEWGPGLDGQPTGPYSLVLVLKLLDAATMDCFAFVAKSIGGAIAIGDLSDKTKIMRRFRGLVSPVVSCGVTNFPIKRLNIVRKRPDFRVLRWVTLGDGFDQKLPPPKPPKQLEQAPVAPVIPDPAPASAPEQKMPTMEAQATTIGAPVTFASVSEPSLREEIDDTIPF